MKADQDYNVLVKLWGPAFKATLKISKKNIYLLLAMKKKTVIYVELLKGMYRTLTAHIVWNKLFASALLENWDHHQYAYRLK